MSLGHGPAIVKDGLRILLDSSNVKSYPATTWTDLITGSTGTNYTLPNSAVSWMNNGVIQLTLTMAIRRNLANPNYSVNPFTKYTGTTDNTFSWYLFGNNAGAAPADDGKLLLYSYINGAWGSVGSAYVIALNETVIATMQFNSSTGGQLWINGVKVGLKANTGVMGSTGNTTALVAMSPTYSSYASPYYFSIYDRELTDSEVQQNFNALRGRYGL